MAKKKTKATTRRRTKGESDPIKAASLADIQKQNALVHTIEIRFDTAKGKVRETKAQLEAARKELDELIAGSAQGKLNFGGKA